MNKQIERHSLKPFIPQGAKLLICGTFPPKREKWSMEFFYPNFINDMWRIFGLVIYNNKDHFVDNLNKTFRVNEIKETLKKLKIAVYDTAMTVHREKDNASDKFLHIIEPINLSEILSQMPDCKYIVTTGEKASSVIASITNTPQPKIGEKIHISLNDNQINFIHYRMPSTSRAYPMKLEQKAEFYKTMLSEIGIL